jgi:hypothetical protein
MDSGQEFDLEQTADLFLDLDRSVTGTDDDANVEPPSSLCPIVKAAASNRSVGSRRPASGRGDVGSRAAAAAEVPTCCAVQLMASCRP